MSKIPALSGEKCIKALEKAGFYFKRQEGNHVTLRRDKPFCQLVVPLHKELDKVRYEPLSAMLDYQSTNLSSCFSLATERYLKGAQLH